MLKAILGPFYEAVNRAREKRGDSPARIADEVMREVFPETVEKAESEGCDRMLREGVVEAIKAYLTKPPVDERQKSFADIYPDFLPYAQKLQNARYFVPGLWCWSGSDAERCQMDEDPRFWAVIIGATAIKLLLSETLSLFRAVATVAAAVFSAYAFTDAALDWLQLDAGRYRLAVAAILALTGENLIRRLLDLTGSWTVLTDFIRAWRGK